MTIKLPFGSASKCLRAEHRARDRIDGTVFVFHFHGDQVLILIELAASGFNNFHAPVFEDLSGVDRVDVRLGNRFQESDDRRGADGLDGVLGDRAAVADLDLDGFAPAVLGNKHAELFCQFEIRRNSGHDFRIDRRGIDGVSNRTALDHIDDLFGNLNGHVFLSLGGGGGDVGRDDDVIHATKGVIFGERFVFENVKSGSPDYFILQSVCQLGLPYDFTTAYIYQY